MEKDEIELIDYFRVIWKRKKLIVVGTLISIVIGVVMSMLSPIIYRAEVAVKCGNNLSFKSSTFSSNFFDSATTLADSIPVEYRINKEPSFGINAKAIKNSSLIRIFIKGSDRRVSEILEGVVNRFIEDYNTTVENVVKPFEDFITQKRVEAKNIKNNMNLYFRYLGKENISETGSTDLDVDSFGVLGDIDKMVFDYSLLCDNIRRNKVKMIGEVEVVTMKAGIAKKTILSGVIGLVMFILLAFFIEYLRNVRDKEKGKSMS